MQSTTENAAYREQDEEGREDYIQRRRVQGAKSTDERARFKSDKERILKEWTVCSEDGRSDRASLDQNASLIAQLKIMCWRTQGDDSCAFGTSTNIAVFTKNTQ